MGVKVSTMAFFLVSTLLGISSSSSVARATIPAKVPAVTQIAPTKGLFIGPLPLRASSKPIDITVQASSTNYRPYSVLPLAQEDTLYNPYTETLGYNDHSNHLSPAEPEEYSDIGPELNSVESDPGVYNDEELSNREAFLDTTDYTQYESHASFNLDGPKQLETIDTKSYHKEVEPYDTNDYAKHHHKEEEEHAEVHYHQHKHLHKHQHKQEHVHKHKEEHKHEHDHKHKHKAHHDHKHHQDHKHHHHSEHKHDHHSHHEHKHKQEHKHDHHHGHHHEHKHKEEHKHKQEHQHKHDHWNDHKHKHWNDHNHDHHHGHKHSNDHKHEHKHENDHSHKHGHKHDHKHNHHESSHHSHHKDKW